MFYHRVANNEDRQVRVAGLHQVNVLQGVSDVKLEILDVHPFSFTLTMTNCWGQKEEGDAGVRKLLQDIYSISSTMIWTSFIMLAKLKCFFPQLILENTI